MWQKTSTLYLELRFQQIMIRLLQLWPVMPFVLVSMLAEST